LAQVNTFNNDWIDFWRRHRLGFQLELAARNHLDSSLIDRGYRLAGELDKFFTTYQPRPSLLHGDLWGGKVTRPPIYRATRSYMTRPVISVIMKPI
jgi:fructosamine-3-kinase